MSHTELSTPSIAILGAGRVGSSLARAAVSAGYEVKVAGSGSVDKIMLTAEILMPGAVATTAEQAVKDADIVFLAVPLHKFRSIDATGLAGKIVIDTMNHWVPVNGELEEIDQDPRSTSEIIAEYFGDAKVVKTFNHIGYHEIEQDAHTGRAIAYATDDAAAGVEVAQVIEHLGFVPLNIGALAHGRVLEPGQEAFGAHLTKDSRLEPVSQR
ncbi:hypothetical protein ccrud_12810 [Corynebacterium crudilactis]|uniref:Pyrroline-5-carboxylate reductase catalytic N-terminal domain-containing protein n=2 Tax=Corynebacterium crudilactis TaxID=1652495 RepID=A0A172QWG2_9CORY|nr:hypothetical protein ccrud_12810 [Corynebacterium crudilactis]